MEESNISLAALSSSGGNKRYMPGLDGLRALSVLAVIAYHVKFPWAPGGLLGVGIFFTLSGYLITDQLMMEWQTTGRLDFKDFWIRRVRRLLPAMFFVLIVVALWLYCSDRSRLMSLRGDFLSVIMYFNNWWLIFHQVSYFESFGPVSPIGHLWSLAIEEQFYLLWPLILTLVLRWVPRRSLRIMVILTGAAASALAMALIYQAGTDPSRVYYGTDTRAFALLIGAALAMVWPSQKMPADISSGARAALELIGLAGLLVIILTIVYTNEFDPQLYTFGLTVFAVISAIVIAAIAHPASLLSKVIGCKPLRWIGGRSYGLYLWHFPVIILTNPAIDTGEFNIGRVVIQVALSFILAAISWRFIEEPIQRGHLASWLHNTSDRQSYIPRNAMIVVISIMIIVVTPGFANLMQYKLQVRPSVFAEEILNKCPLPLRTQEYLTSDRNKKADPPPDTIKTTEKPVINAMQNGQGITAIGDSVMLDVAPELTKLLPGIIIDGKIGRQMTEAKDIVENLKKQGKLGNVVIIELGTNGPFSEKELESLVVTLGDVERIVLVNTRVPRMWQDAVNSDLQKAAAKIPNASLVDWYSASKGQNSFFSPDGVHLTPEGSKYYAAMLSQAIVAQTKEIKIRSEH